MKIMQIAPFAFPVGDNARYGGIEQVVNDLDKGFAKQGHESHVVATGDSKIFGILLPAFDHGLWVSQEDKSSGWKYGKEEFNYDQKREEHSGITLEYIRRISPDVIHDHVGFVKTNVFRDAGELPPILYTLHDPVDPESKERLKSIGERSSGRVFFNAISESQKRFFDDFVPVDYVVYNAIDVSDYPYSSRGEGFAFHLGLLNKPKGTDIALDAARASRKKIVIAGPILTGRIHEPNRIGVAGNFWRDEIKPRLDCIVDREIKPEQVGDFVDEFMESRHNSVYVGELNDAQKKEWYFP